MDIHGLLNEGADPNIGNEEVSSSRLIGGEALFGCISRCCVRTLSQDFSNTPLHYACRYAHLNIIKMLMHAGADINQVNELGVTPLGFAATFNQPEPRQPHYLKMIKWMIKNGADVNVVDKGGHTPLEIAASWGNMKLVSLLLQCQARVRREVEFLSIKTPSPVDAAANDDVRQLLKTKLKRELIEVARLNDIRKAEELSRLIEAERAKETAKKAAKAEIRKKAREAARALKRNADALKGGNRSELDAERARIREEAIEARLAAEALAADTNSGVWRKERAHVWKMHRLESKQASQGTSTMDEAKALIEDMQGEAQRTMLQRRWKAMTGLEITKDHMVMGGGGGNKIKKTAS